MTDVQPNTGYQQQLNRIKSIISDHKLQFYNVTQHHTGYMYVVYFWLDKCPKYVFSTMKFNKADAITLDWLIKVNLYVYIQTLSLNIGWVYL